ncbi:putative baseplate assembly protein [Reticulibacter mediterranei]|uniref:Putative baseplate assembly protein n=1 Tax=Reticulibacter mediterranei TaxID=2778369 RepID=A0A8J3IFQ3_9CHLR|nr:putative baseplate assembly protein [Reticulibacter mediterranei]GHO90349.1 putative baseplate assembly protein [Reticulibacter mediterranei]
MLTSNRGRIQPPDLDDRTWQDLVDQAVALIPRYAPQWTDFSPGDPGRTLIELFAWLVEGLTYRLNRVPEKNYIAFLNLLGITRDPAVPAHTFLTFKTQSSVTTPVLVPARTHAQTQGTETEAPIVFETDEDINVLPSNLQTVLLVAKPTTAVATYTDITNSLANAVVSGYPVTLPGAANSTTSATPVQLFLGFDKPTTQPIQLRIQLSQPAPVTISGTTTQPQVTASWAFSTGTNEPSSWTALTTTGATPQVADNTNALVHDGVISLTIPATWGSQAPSAWATVDPSPGNSEIQNALFWISITLINVIPATTTQAPSIQIGFNYILFNAVSARNALTITSPETLGQSDGTTPFQIFQLKNRPLFKRPGTDTPYDHLTIQVNGATWTQVDDFLPGPGNVYRLNPVTGEINFGNYNTTQAQPGTHGTIPPTGAQITATTYRYVAGGTSGSVGAGKINALSVPISNIASVTNLAASFDAADEESIDDTLQRAPLELKSRDRAITAEDYEVLASEASNEVAIVRCLPPHLHDDREAHGAWNVGDPWTFAGINRAPGNVNVIIVPNQGTGIPRPTPSKDLLQEVQAYLDKRRTLTSALRVSGPYYLPVAVTVSVSVWSRAITQGLINSEDDVKTDMQNKLQNYLHPIYGGLDRNGWQVGQSVFIADLFKAIMPDENLGFITSLTMVAETPAYTPSTRPTQPPASQVWVNVAEYELVCYGTSSAITATRI